MALAIWLRIIVTFLGQLEQFTFLIGLIRYSCKASVTFIIVFICGVTAFADSFNALEQRFMINGE